MSRTYKFANREMSSNKVASHANAFAIPGLLVGASAILPLSIPKNVLFKSI
jgi:hypothetical protein